MEVLALEDARFCFGVDFADARDVDVEAIPHIDPACVDDVLPLAAVAPAGVRVDVEQVFALGLVVCEVVSVDSVVECVGHAVEGGGVDLGINIPVPRKHLDRVVPRK